ncbi:tetratricopeptide repeat protein [Streptomyces chartreusis]|uniref:tetratricopeptide repeat protein n=1 Tax=Streptomyces chartreusis TaxID=1969 RepID=UPI0035E1748D
MRWRKLRPWFALVGPLLALLVVTAAPAGVKAGELPWPKWLVAGVVAAGGVLLAVWTPLVQARTDALAARTTRAAERDAQAEAALNRLPALKGKVLLVKDVADRALLGIHEAIPLPGVSASEQVLSPELPTYVLRDIDADLRTVLEARSKTGGFVLLVGPAAVGKTRCAYEAIRAVLPHWRLFMPPDGATLTELVTSGTNLKHSVVWLNETQNFVTGSDRLRASTVRRMLADTTRPLILIGTIWPSVYNQLRTPAIGTDEENDDGQDLNKDAREVLELARRFSLSRWSDQEWERAEELISVDPRINQVLRHRSHIGLAQMLSAAPELIHRWEQADNPFGQAVITAATVARRCSHPATVPVPVIEALAKQFLAGNERAIAGEEWLTEALMWACRPVHNSGDIAPLQAFGESMGQVDGYQVSDILVDHETQSAPITQEQINPTVWESLVEWATPEACLPIGTRAYYVDMPVIAAAAWKRAADAGIAGAMFNLGFLLDTQGEAEGARTWYTRAAEAGESRAMFNLGNLLLFKQDDSEGARTWWQRAAETGEAVAMHNLAKLMNDQGDVEGARTWYTRAADTGRPESMHNLAKLMDDQGDVEGARTWYTRAADTGYGVAMFSLGNFLRVRQNDTDGARTLYTRAANTGHTGAMYNLGKLLHTQDDTEGALSWYTRAADAGDTGAMFNLGHLFNDQGNTEGARTWWQRAAEAGDTGAMFNLGNLLDDQGDVEGARTWWQRAAEAGDASAMFNLGNLLDDQGDTDGARAWYTRAAEAGHASAMFNLGHLLYNQGDTEGARTWYTRAADTGDTDAVINLGNLLISQGDTEGALTLWQRAAEAGDTEVAAALSTVNEAEV